MFIMHDPDLWEQVSTSESYGTCFGVPMGSCSVGWRQRSPEDVARRRAARKLEREDEILRWADEIRARRVSAACGLG